MFSNTFTNNQAEQINKGVICVQILLEIHLTEHGRFHFQGRTPFYIPVLSHPAGICHQNDVGLTSMRAGDVTGTSVRRHFNVKHLLGSNVVFVL